LKLDISAYTKILLRIARKVFKSAKPADWDDELISRIFDDLAGAAQKGYGEKWIKFDPYHSPTVKLLQKNLFFFSVGKSMAELQELNALLVDENGKMRDWPSFRDAVLKLNKRYNKAYLQAEWQTARASAQQARIWNEAMEVKDLYPNLEYVTARDDRVRDSHAKLDGIIRPIDDKFWDTHYPPNGWRCRCSVRSSDAEPTPENKIPHVDVHPHFRHNVGKIGQIFNEKQHPYFKYIECNKGLHASFEDCRKRFEKIADNELANYTKKLVKRWARKNLVGKTITAKDKPSFVLSNRDVNTILSKPHKDRWLRNMLLTDLERLYRESKLVYSKSENKGRSKYKYWYYYEVTVLGKKFYLNIKMLANGEKKLHAITDSLRKE